MQSKQDIIKRKAVIDNQPRLQSRQSHKALKSTGEKQGCLHSKFPAALFNCSKIPKNTGTLATRAKVESSLINDTVHT